MELPQDTLYSTIHRIGVCKHKSFCGKEFCQLWFFLLFFFVSINSFCVHIFMIGETVVADWRCHRCAARTALRIDDKKK